jgi:hypothetical protein
VVTYAFPPGYRENVEEEEEDGGGIKNFES